MALSKRKPKKDKDDEASPEATSPAEPPQAPAPRAKPKRYRVKASKQVSIGGSVTTLAAGKLIEERYYGGERGIKNLRAAGVELEEITSG